MKKLLFRQRITVYEIFIQLWIKSNILSMCKQNNALKCFYDFDLFPKKPFHFLGVHQILLNAIAGSVGRPGDYDAQFRPLKRHLMNRWVNIALLWQLKGWDPIRLIQVGEEYYVWDGHNRVSVANAMKLKNINAEIWTLEC